MRRFQLPRVRLRWFLILGLIGFAFAAQKAWTNLTRPWGSQKVAYVAAEQQCGSSGRLRYCVYRAVGGTNGDVLYHLHGRKLDERIWNDDTYMTAMVQAQWQATGVAPPTVVTLSYGDEWLLTPRGAREESGLLEDLMSRLPEIERKTGTPERRLLLGESMGGLNVLIAGLSEPQAFSKLAALCPGVYADSPFGSLSSTRAAVERTGANPKMAFGIWLLARRYLADESEWRRVSPLSLIERAQPDFPALYLSTGLYDAYGNYEGTQLLAKRAAARGVRTEWRPLYGGHCATDIASLASFLVS
ncbi:alpha/beta hydrolase-fold protein [uncultured Brevundimonas sp.]|uniref:alpha/beta hydrolase-fold protein n=1 Tax=uncultured Brevundimonas sp. TaxID=213418 RepID=UPI0025F1DF0E|nr:alpha/beta hydrolase-fold protein [uncultured Brevundimonas sp.]